MDNIEVSIIVPVYNTEKYLKRCMDSLLNQTIQNYEIILVDDGSKDSSGALCDEYASANSNVHVLHKQNGGQGAARNDGLTIARGKWIGFIDSDDFIELNTYKYLCELGDMCNAGMVSCCMNSLNTYNKENDLSYKTFEGKEKIKAVAYAMIGTRPEVEQDMLLGMSVCRSIFQRSIIMDYNLTFISEREISSEDLIFNLEYLPHITSLVYSNAQLYHYCYNEGSFTHTFDIKRFQQDKKLYDKVQVVLAPFQYAEADQLIVDRMFITKLRINILNNAYNIKQVGFKQVYKNNRIFVKDDYVRKIVKRYPGYKLKGNRKLVFYLVKYKCNLLLVLAGILFGKKNNKI